MLSILCFFCQCNNNAEENTGTLSASESFLPVVNDSYVYPVVPGTDAWKNLGSTENVYKVCQLPDNVLKSISTLGLIRSILDIPGLTSFYDASSNSSIVGTFYRIFAHYNSVGELEKRKDSNKALISFYNAVNVDALKSASDEVEQNNLLLQHTALEILFTRPEILQQFDLKQKKQLITSLLSRYNQITQQIGLINGHGTITAVARILVNIKYDPIVQYYGDNKIAEGFHVDPNQTDDIIKFANDYID
jgi:hypothetical protein